MIRGGLSSWVDGLWERGGLLSGVECKFRKIEVGLRSTVDGRYVGFTFMWERSICGFRAGEAWGAQRAGFVRGTKGAITSKVKHAIKHKTSPTRLAQLLHNCYSPH